MSKASDRPNVSAVERAPPQNLEAEQSTLGSMMLDKGALEVGLDMLREGDFYRPNHQEIFAALGILMKRDEPVDLITLQEELRRRGKLEETGGTEYLMALVDSVPTAANVRHYAHIVQQKAVRRKLAEACREIYKLAWDDEELSVAEITSKAELLIMAAGDRNGNDTVPLSQGIDQVWEDIEAAKRGQVGIPLVLPGLARECIGLMPGELTVLAARTRIGKSAFAFQQAKHAAQHGYAVAIFSNEMTLRQYAMRALASASGVEIRRMLTGKVEDHHWQQLADAVSELYGLPVTYTNASGWNMERIAGRCRRLVSGGAKLLIIDHVHRVEPATLRASRNDQVNQIIGACKNIAQNLNVPVLAAAQLNRNIEKRGEDAEPTLSDLRDSGGVEEHADSVWMLWRKMAWVDDKRPEFSEAKIIVAKGRMLGESVVKCQYHGRRFRFEEIEEHHADPGKRRPAKQEQPPLQETEADR